MRPDIPRGRAKAAEIGDIQFESQAPDSRTVVAIFFVRGNLQVSIRSAGKRPVDVVRFAADIDQRFTRRFTAAERKAEAVKTLRPATLAPAKAEKAVLLEKLPERTRRAGWVRVIVPDGEVRREDDALHYLPEEPGQKRIEILNLRLD